MKPEDFLLFACTRQNFDLAHREKVLNILNDFKVNWETVFHTAELHGVAPLIYANLIKAPEFKHLIPKMLQEKYRLISFQNVIKKEYGSKKLESAIRYFSERSIDVILFKGGALDMQVYKQSWFTDAKDIDLILRCRRAELLPSEKHDMMEHFHQSGIEFDFYQHHDMNLNDALPVDFDQVWQDASKVPLKNNDEVLILSPEDTVISLCVNSCRKRYFRLKSICDIAESIRYLPSLDWHKLEHKSRSYDCQYIVYTALYVTKKTVGIDTKPEVYNQLIKNNSRKKLINRIVNLLIEKSSLPDLYSSKEKARKKITISPSLLLVYSTYKPYQIWRKLRELVFY